MFLSLKFTTTMLPIIFNDHKNPMIPKTSKNLLIQLPLFFSFYLRQKRAFPLLLPLNPHHLKKRKRKSVLFDEEHENCILFYAQA